MRRAERFFREMMLAGASMGRRRRLPRWAEAVACGVALGTMALAFACALARALDGEAALWHVGEYGRVAPEEVGDGLE